MTRESAPEPAHHFDAMPGDAMITQTFALWQEYFALGTASWNAMIGAYCPEHPFHRRQAHHDPHLQLIVPEPIEDEGERALLA
ncbi:MAG: hypothetical protein V4475_02450 [Pseudomonadota bacterium]